MGIKQIVSGHVNELFNINEDISEKRLRICYACPIYSPKFGGVCNSDLWLNPNTEDVSLYKQDGYFRGCGCRLGAKTRVQDAECPAGKW